MDVEIDEDVFTCTCDRCDATVGYDGGGAFAEGWAEVWFNYGNCVDASQPLLCPDCQEKFFGWMMSAASDAPAFSTDEDAR